MRHTLRRVTAAITPEDLVAAQSEVDEHKRDCFRYQHRRRSGLRIGCWELQRLTAEAVALRRAYAWQEAPRVGERVRYHGTLTEHHGVYVVRHTWLEASDEIRCTLFSTDGDVSLIGARRRNLALLPDPSTWDVTEAVVNA